MDETLTTHVLSSLLPPDLVDLINTHILDPRSPIQAFTRQALAQARYVLDALLPLLRPLADRLLALLEDNQGALDMLVPLLVLVVFFLVVNWVRRLVMWWTRLAVRAVFWAAVAAVAAWVWNRGVLESARDAAVVGAKVVGYMAVLKNVWLDEYKRYEGQEASGRWDEYGHAQGHSSSR